MKTILTIAFMSVLAFTTSAVATNVSSEEEQVNNNSCFNYFRAHRQAKAVALSWSINSPEVVAFKIELSFDGGYDYYPVETINSNGAGQYKFMDHNAGGGNLYYRIQAVYEDGNCEISKVEFVKLMVRK
ncbi:MAG: hypothetical protein M3413_03690 [Bacteroidota bacterium]|nr:hypothetical protein [Bacteroidota bacterium]